MKILSIMVLYRPEQSLLQKNIEAIIEHVDTLIVWNNTPEKMSFPCVETSDKLIYINEGLNVGLPRAYNFAWRYACDNGFTHMLTMDQDSFFPRLGEFVEYVANQNQTAIYAPYVFAHGVIPLVESCQQVPKVINSGALIPVAILTQTHGYDEDFFLDKVDDEFCMHARKLGYAIYQLADFRLEQRFGNIREIMVMGKVIARTCNYSAMRIYGMCRNERILWRRYNLPYAERLRQVWGDAKAMLKMLCFEDDKWLKLRAYGYGCYDGCMQRPSRIKMFMK